MATCPQCNTERVPGEGFCDNCGHKYTDADGAGQQEAAPEQQYEAPQQYDPPQEAAPEQPAPQAAGRLSVEGAGGAEAMSIEFGGAPRAVGRQDLEGVITAQGKDPLQMSRKQCTISAEGGACYIEDGVTPVQDKPSGNHTTVNGEDITGKGRRQLADGDRIVLATLVTATFRAG